MNGVEYDPNYAASYRAWLEGGAADEGGEEEGDYAEEEEQRINALITSFKEEQNRKGNKRGRPKGSTNSESRKMQSQDEDGPESPPASNLADGVYKGSGTTRTEEVSQKELEKDFRALIDKIGTEKAYQLLGFFKQPERERERRDQLLVNNITTKQLSEISPADLALVVISQYNNCKPFLDLYFLIKGYTETSKPIEATIIYLSAKKGICYLSLIHKLFPSKNRATIYFAFKRLEAQGIIEVKDKNNGYSEQARQYEHAIQIRNNRSMPFLENIIYYGLSDTAKIIHKPLMADLGKLIPRDIERKIKERGMKSTLYHTPKEQEYQQTQELKYIREEIASLWEGGYNATIKYVFGKDTAKLIHERLSERYGSDAAKNMTPLQFQQLRLSILKELYEEANKHGR